VRIDREFETIDTAPRLSHLGAGGSFAHAHQPNPSMITPKRVVETTPLVVAQIKLREQAQRSRTVARPRRRPSPRPPR